MVADIREAIVPANYAFNKNFESETCAQTPDGNKNSNTGNNQAIYLSRRINYNLMFDNLFCDLFPLSSLDLIPDF